MGNLPAKISGKYQSYDINTPSQITPPLTLKRNSTNNSYYNEQQHHQSDNTISRASQQQNYSVSNGYNHARNGYDSSEKKAYDANDEEDNDDDEDRLHHRQAWQEHINQRNSKHDSFNEEIFNSSQQKLEESIIVRDSRIIENSLGGFSPDVNKSRRPHLEDDDDDEGKPPLTVHIA